MDTERTICVLARSTYGLWRYYPQGATAELFCKLTGTQTLTMDHMRIIRELGYRIVKNVDSGEEV